jgi:hypothetical protein
VLTKQGGVCQAADGGASSHLIYSALYISRICCGHRLQGHTVLAAYRHLADLQGTRQADDEQPVDGAQPNVPTDPNCACGPPASLVH